MTALQQFVAWRRRRDAYLEMGDNIIPFLFWRWMAGMLLLLVLVLSLPGCGAVLAVCVMEAQNGEKTACDGW